MHYTQINSEVIDQWVGSGWEWSLPIDSETFARAKAGDWSVVLTPTKAVPKAWFLAFQGCKILGLASGGGQQIPIFSALGAECTVLDYSEQQLAREKEVAEREGYSVTTLRADMTQPFPFADQSFDLIFHPVSNCYVQEVESIWQECFRVLKPGGVLLAGLDNGFNYLFDEAEEKVVRKLPFNPLQDPELYQESLEKDWGIQFSHTIEEQLGGQLRAGFRLTDIFHDTNGSGHLHAYNAPCYYATRAVKPEV
ncbi:SAM-dependent methyltransferase [bacterium (Candidatus Blackallbacteria) CG17_big_fil_post_rev_8_21_14_2_50_48_46]|uniref:SAM-dependent methyltransferase n=1 Tax=bacterium (Candidatus Blackallbacteria) CG17_big_fil_post_rev_8_21_14_2_50_48_46 TaxID=2014261 RepID=A0A2M7G4M5_9BACT|nr:MAG: SAM-dependent methyltransferase [bacterium (Candidatus Blackallbacteria) CG18_big_fil_WC_8_21_14_2_50_49_26]PIW16862.1 MAG: SAM-dependent methyltransferase [bacterium (Candidatus Blackallbacteria) CG17_big_fil_post_rev_8_21_14_2_50_48_46]PIW48059.1 MAG: SAM-dependent methyltransferase [bacterium (Candidatus Blackallbacteria) CG13_big_fil_rev_8_21_14_2_50_49_14]